MRWLLLFLLAAPAWANMASPTEPGTPAGEPAAALDGLRIAREALTLDLRPLGRGRPFGAVEAEYRIVNTGEARTVPLEFLTLGDDGGAAEVWLDGRPVRSVRVDSLAVPPAWTVAERTPALDGDPSPYETRVGFGRPTGLRFVVTIPPGQHTVRVRYRVRPGSYDAGGHPNRVWQTAYSLAPARRWAGFGTLDVTVWVPAAWEAAASLPLRREGDALVGRFDRVPGDVLAVSLRAPAPALRWPLRAAGVAVALLAVGFVGVVSGRLAARAGRGVGAAWPGAVLGGVLAAAAVVAFVGVADDLGDSAAHGYGSMTTLVFVVGPAVLVGGGLATLAVAWGAGRREEDKRRG